MIAASKPANEALRMEVVTQYACSYAPREERFDRITRSVCGLLNVPIAAVTVMDDDTQWLRSVQGLAATHTPRDISFCGHVVSVNKALVVPDTLKDPRFFDNPLVVGKPFVRAYAGIPLEVEPGIVIGSLCAIDIMPRSFSTEEILSLADMADIVVSELQKRPSPLRFSDRMMMGTTRASRAPQIDDATGRWNKSGLLRTLDEAINYAREQSLLALVTIRVFSYDSTNNDGNPPSKEEVMAIIAQHIQERLPEEAVLSHPEPDVFCVVVPGLHREDVERLVQVITEDVHLPQTPGIPIELALRLQCSTAWISANDFENSQPDDVLRKALMSVSAA